MFECLKNLPAPLLEWYEKNRRILPWREQPEPYRVWISEIMLQQTRVEAALPHFQRFLAVLPNVEALAEAPEEQLLKLWEGLGYYSRVRNLQKAAQVLVREHGGQLPADYEALRALPGIGDYTAGAISSIAFGLPEPAVDGNVLRIATRICGDSSDISSARVKKQYREALRPLYAGVDAGDFTQALMELGATVCLPNGAPLCGICPARDFCAAHEQGKELAYPVKPPKKARKIEERTIWLVVHEGRLLLHRRPKKGLLAGLWELPSELPQGIVPEEIRPCGSATHIFSHIEWYMEGKIAHISGEISPDETWRWVTAEELQKDVALPSAFEHFARVYLREIL